MSPERKPASGDVLTRETLVIALEEIGLTAEVAKKVVTAIFEAMTSWLKDGGRVKTPLGVFSVVRRPPERTLFRLGKERKFNTKPKRVAFRPSRELRDACNRSIPTEVPVPVSNVNPDHQTCEKCGSSYFVEGQFKQYRPGHSTAPGGDISSLSEYPVKALVCLCGQPVPPGPRRRFGPGESENSKSFRKSFEAARQYREHTGPKAILLRVAGLYASLEQHDELAERIAKLQAILNEPAPPQPSPPPP
jgi:nucleoid DNA-binding protein